MSKTVVTTNTQIELVGDSILMSDERDAIKLLACDAEAIKWHRLGRGSVLIFRKVEVTAVIEMIAEWRWGFNGQKRETITNRKERIITEDTPRKLWRTKKRGWYWLTQ